MSGSADPQCNDLACIASAATAASVVMMSDTSLSWSESIRQYLLSANIKRIIAVAAVKLMLKHCTLQNTPNDSANAKRLNFYATNLSVNIVT